jgi:hypothetical protein
MNPMSIAMAALLGAVLSVPVAGTASAATSTAIHSPVKRAKPQKAASVRVQEPVAVQAVPAIGPIAQAVAEADAAEQQLRRIQQRLQQRSVHPYGTGYEERQAETGEQKAQVPERGGAPERVERVEKPTLERVERPVVERVERPTQDRPGGAQAGGRR